MRVGSTILSLKLFCDFMFFRVFNGRKMIEGVDGGLIPIDIKALPKNS